MAKIDTDRDTVLSFGELCQLRRGGWISEATGEDAVIALATKIDDFAPGETGEIELIDSDRDGQVITLDFEVTREGLVNFALRAKCECGNPWTLCHPDA